MKWMVFCFMVLMAVPAIAQDCNGLIPCESSWDIFMSDMVKKGRDYVRVDVWVPRYNDEKVAFIPGGVCIFHASGGMKACYMGQLKAVRLCPPGEGYCP